jgi:hypothetical protein
MLRFKLNNVALAVNIRVRVSDLHQLIHLYIPEFINAIDS